MGKREERKGGGKGWRKWKWKWKGICLGVVGDKGGEGVGEENRARGMGRVRENKERDSRRTHERELDLVLFGSERKNFCNRKIALMYYYLMSDSTDVKKPLMNRPR